jgi:very-short-patch-repair endonuclease
VIDAMANKTKTLIYQPEYCDTKIDVRLTSETVWMTQKAIAELFQKRVNTINEHIKYILKHLEGQNCLKYYTIVKKEGTRKIKREILHYNLDVIFNIAIRGQFFEEFNKLINFANANDVITEFLVFVPIKERKFGNMLKSTLDGVVDIYTQFKVEKYIVDFYISEVGLVIEYDEKHHKKQIDEDEERQKFIEEKLGVEFIRVNEGEELYGLNRVIKFLMKKELQKSNGGE